MALQPNEGFTDLTLMHTIHETNTCSPDDISLALPLCPADPNINCMPPMSHRLFDSYRLFDITFVSFVPLSVVICSGNPYELHTCSTENKLRAACISADHSTA